MMKDDFVADVEARVAALKGRSANEASKQSAVVVYATIALKAIGRAVESAESRAVRAELLQAQAILSACLTLDKVDSRAVRRDWIDAALLEHVRAHPGEPRASIAKKLGVEVKTLVGPIKRLVLSRKIEVRGDRRRGLFPTN